MIVDAHIHSDSRGVEDFQKISIAGVKAVVSCAYDPLEMKQSNVCFEHFNRLLTVEKRRVEQHNIKYFMALGIHPRAIPTDYENVLDKLPEYLSKEDVIAVGEIGLDSTSNLEQEVFIKQLKIADEIDCPVIVHTPRNNKAEVTSKTIELIDEHINPELVQLDHVDFSIVDKVIDKKYTPAITIQPQKMSVESTINLFDEYGFDKFVVDTDMSYAPSNPMNLALLKHELEINNYEKKNVDKVMYKNFMKFHNLKSI
ncbi:MAG: TatD family hydrolase [Methanosphaera sp.]|nr:TatD family hydrolase [Methanosphaera sp.]